MAGLTHGLSPQWVFLCIASMREHMNTTCINVQTPARTAKTVIELKTFKFPVFHQLTPMSGAERKVNTLHFDKNTINKRTSIEHMNENALG